MKQPESQMSVYDTQKVVLEKCYSIDGESFMYTEFSELMSALRDTCDVQVGTPYFEAEFKRVTAEDIVDVDRLIEEWDERLYDICGECAEDGVDASQPAIKELEDFLIKWVDKNTDVHRYYTIVGRSRGMCITQEDLDSNE